MQDKETVLEIRISYFEPQLKIHAIVLVVLDAEAIAFEQLTIGYSTIA